MSHACTVGCAIFVAMGFLAGEVGASVIPFPNRRLVDKEGCQDNIELPPPRQLGRAEVAHTFSGKGARLRATDSGRVIRVKFEIPEHFRLGPSSPDGKYHVLYRDDYKVTRLVYGFDGRTLVERRAESADVSFAPGSRYAVLRTDDRVEIFDLAAGASGRVSAAYDLGRVQHELDWASGATTTRNSRGEVHLVPNKNQLVAFFDGFQPVILKLEKPPSFAVTEVGETWGAGEADGPLGRMHRNKGLVTPSAKSLVGIVMEPFLLQTTFDFHALRDGRHQRSVSVPSVMVGAIAVSKDDRYFAVSMAPDNVIQVFDFEYSARVPRWEIRSGKSFVEQLSFFGANGLYVTRDEDHSIQAFRLE